MQSDIKTIALVIASTLAAACSGTPRATAQRAGTVAQSQQATQTLIAAKNAPTAPSIATTTATTTATVPAPVGDVDPKLVKAGYSVMRRHGEIYYCRNEIITGQRIGSRICLTAGQLQDEQQNVTKARDMMNQPSYQCLGASCSN